MTDSDTPKPKSRWYQFNLRTLLVLVTVIGVALGLFVKEWHLARRKHQAAEEIQRHGGRVRLADPPEATGVVSGWLHLFLGDEFFAEVSNVSLGLRSEEYLDLLGTFPELEGLNLSGPAVTDSALERLNGLTQLSALQLDGAVIGERGLESLTHLSNLRFLSFQNCSLSEGAKEVGLQRLAELPNLQSVGLHHCGLSDDNLKALPGAPSLVRLRLRETNVTETGILAIRDTNPALGINFGENSVLLVTELGTKQVPENYLPSVQELPDVTELAFEGPRISDATLAVLKDARCLKALWLDQCCISDDGLKSLCNLNQFTRLDLIGTNENATVVSNSRQQAKSSDLAHCDCQVTDHGLEHISHLNSLTHLGVYNCPLTDDAMHPLGRLKNLTELYLSRASITDEGLRELNGLTKLRILHLTSTNIEGQGLRWLPKSITWLNLYHTDVTDEGLASITGLTSIENLTLCGTQITDDGLRELAGMNSLRQLDVTETAISDAGVAELQRALLGCKITK